MKEVVITSADELVSAAHESLMFALRSRMDADAVFAKTYTHPRVRITMAVKFHFSNRHLPETQFEIAEGHAAHTEPDASHYLESVTREIEIQNPNLERLAAGIPFTQVDIEKPKPGELVGSIRTTEIPIDKNDYPKPAPPVDTDNTEAEEKRLGIKEEKRIGKKRRQR